MNEWNVRKKGKIADCVKCETHCSIKIGQLREIASSVKTLSPHCHTLYHYCTTLFHHFCSFAAGICAIFQTSYCAPHKFSKRNCNIFIFVFASVVAIFFKKNSLSSYFVVLVCVFIYLHLFFRFMFESFDKLYFAHSVHNQHLPFIHWLALAYSSFSAWIWCSWRKNHIWFAKMIALQIQMRWILNDYVCLFSFSWLMCFFLCMSVHTLTEGK